MALLPADEVGRGNQDLDNQIRISPIAAKADLTIAGTITFTGDDVVTITFPDPSGTDLTIGIGVGTRPTGVTIGIASGSRTGSVAANNIVDGINVSSSFVATQEGAVVHIALANAGVTSTAPTIGLSPGTIVGFALSNPAIGVAGVEIDETEYVFNGPFANIIAPLDPLQGLATQARLITTRFLNTLTTATITTGAELASAVALAGTRWDDVNKVNNPFNIAVDGIFRAVSEDGKIAIKGTRKDSSGNVGRGIHGRDFVYTNEIANNSVRQIILRRFDNIFDLLEVIAGFTAGAITPAEVNLFNSFVSGINKNFQIEEGELDAVLGKPGRAFENTVVDRSADQGLLVISDALVASIRALRGITEGTLISVTAGIDKRKLLLKN